MFRINLTPLLSVFFALLLFSWEAFALEEPDILPKGISRFRVVGVVTNKVTNSFDKDGESVSNGMRRVDAKQMAARQPILKQAVDGLNKIRAGLGDNLIFFDVDSGVSIRRRIYAAAYETGITDRLNLGVRVYSMYDQASRYAKSEVVRRGNTVEQAKALAPTNNMLNVILGSFNSKKDAELAAGFDQNVKAGLSAQGYQYPANFSRFKLSYTEVGAKYLIHKGEKSITSALFGVRVPTGKENDMTNPFDQEIRDNVWGLGLEIFQSYSPTSFLELRAAAKGKYFFNKTKQRAVPLSPADTFPSVAANSKQIKNATQRHSPRFNGELAAVVNMADNAVTAWGAYQYSYTGSIEYTGPDANSFYYEGLKKDSSNSTAAELGLSYSTIPAFRAKKFALPMSLAATYNTKLSGISTADSSYLRMDLSVYF